MGRCKEPPQGRALPRVGAQTPILHLLWLRSPYVRSRHRRQSAPSRAGGRARPGGASALIPGKGGSIAWESSNMALQSGLQNNHRAAPEPRGWRRGACSSPFMVQVSLLMVQVSLRHFYRHAAECARPVGCEGETWPKWGRVSPRSVGRGLAALKRLDSGPREGVTPVSQAARSPTR